jgi:hypothetical protein
MKTKIITNLSGTSAEGNHFEPHGTLQHVAHIPRPGIICQLKLGANGLQYCRAGVVTHVIPREQLIALFEMLEPKFAELPKSASGDPANTRPREVDEFGAALLSRSNGPSIPPRPAGEGRGEGEPIVNRIS